MIFEGTAEGVNGGKGKLVADFRYGFIRFCKPLAGKGKFLFLYIILQRTAHSRREKMRKIIIAVGKGAR